MSPYRLRRAFLAAGAVLVGLALVLRPFDSLTWFALTLGIALALGGIIEIIRGRECASGFSVVGGGVMIACGMVLAGWPNLTALDVGIVTAVGLTAFGISRLVDAVRGEGAARTADALLGVASLALAYVACAIPGITIFTAALAIGISLLWFAVATLITAFGRRSSRSRAAPRIVVAALAALVAVPLAVVSFQTSPTWRIWQGAPAPDAFYEDAADGPPGTLLRVSPFVREIPDGAQAWRILYSTRRGDRPVLASGIVVAPREHPATPRPLIAWAHGTTGVVEGCAPSLLPHPFTSGAMPALSKALEQGWAVVATDYVGLGTQGPHPYLIGQDEARSVLDATRAARSLDGLNLSPKTVVWGYSQGGHAALWADLTAPTYAPDVVLSGVAALAPASDLRAIVRGFPSTPGTAEFGAYILDSYSRAYPQIHPADYLRRQTRLPMKALSEKCRTEPGIATSVTQALAVGSNPYSQSLSAGPLGRRLAENTPLGTSATPLLVLQGADDQLISEATQSAYVDQLRSLGTAVDYRTFDGLDHPGIIDDDSPAVADLIAWSREQLA